MSKYVFSTLTASQQYPIWVRVPGHDLPRVESYVVIHGGANLPSKILVTPRGVVTEVSDEKFQQLEQSPGFKQHLENGFLTVEDRAHDPEKVAGNMKPKDTSAPMVPEDFEKEGKKPPTTGPISDSELEPDHSTVRSTQRPAQAATAPKDPEQPKRRGRGRPRKDQSASQ